MHRARLAFIPPLLLGCLCTRLFPPQASAEARAAAVPSTTAPAFPGTPAGQQLTAWLRALNGGDLQAMRAFAAEHYTAAALAQRSAADRASVLAQIYEDTRGLRVDRVERSTEREITVLAQSPLTEAWVRVTVQAAEVPHAITGITLARVPRPAGAGPRGKMSDTDTSGLGDYFNEKFMQASRDRFRTIQDYLPLFVNEPLLFEPGARWSYSNAGFMVLGEILEKVSGRSYFDEVRERVYKPAGMVNTDAYEMDRDVPNLAIGYTKMGMNGEPESGLRRNNLFMHVIKGGPAGGGFSTVEDLLRFDVALRKHRLLSPATTDLVLAGKVKAPFGPDAKYAYGFIEERMNGKRITGHGGGFPGISAQLDMYLDQGYTVAVLSNYEGAAQTVANKLREMLTQE
jgi:hypothetical protein